MRDPFSELLNHIFQFILPSNTSTTLGSRSLLNLGENREGLFVPEGN